MTTTKLFVGTALAIFAGGCFSVSEKQGVSFAAYQTLVGHRVDWKGASWISAADAREATDGEKKAQQAPEGTSAFYREIVNAKPLSRVVVSASGLGVFNVYANESRVGDEILKPGFTDAKKTK